mgnify:CR=1 FL=1
MDSDNDIIESDNIDELENTKSNKEKRVVLDSVGKVKIDEIETEEQLEKLQEKTNEKLKEKNKDDVNEVKKYADGAIIGTQIVKLCAEFSGEKLVKEIDKLF